MRTMQRIISTGFAAAAIAGASLPAFSWTVWPDVDFEWYANVGKPVAGSIEVFPAQRAGQIWAPGHYESNGASQQWVAGQWIVDDFERQSSIYATAGETVATGPLELRDRNGNVIPTSPDAYPIATGPMELRDRGGNVIPTSPDAYPVDSARR